MRLLHDAWCEVLLAANTCSARRMSNVTSLNNLNKGLIISQYTDFSHSRYDRRPGRRLRYHWRRGTRQYSSGGNSLVAKDEPSVYNEDLYRPRLVARVDERVERRVAVARAQQSRAEHYAQVRARHAVRVGLWRHTRQVVHEKSQRVPVRFRQFRANLFQGSYCLRCPGLFSVFIFRVFGSNSENQISITLIFYITTP